MALDIRIAGKYRLGRKIGGGSFGDIYLGKPYKPNPSFPNSLNKQYLVLFEEFGDSSYLGTWKDTESAR